MESEKHLLCVCVFELLFLLLSTSFAYVRYSLLHFLLLIACMCATASQLWTFVRLNCVILCNIVTFFLFFIIVLRQIGISSCCCSRKRAKTIVRRKRSTVFNVVHKCVCACVCAGTANMTSSTFGTGTKYTPRSFSDSLQPRTLL